MSLSSLRKFGILFTLIFTPLLGCSSKESPDSSFALQYQQAQLAAIENRASTATPAFTSVANREQRSLEEIAPGFLLQITCLEDETISGKYRVEFDGTMKLPYEVKLAAAGSTSESLVSELKTAYRHLFKDSPYFTVQVLERKYFVQAQGLIDKPGEYLVTPQDSLDQVIAQAGGLQKGNDAAPIARFAKLEDGSYKDVIKLSDYYSGAVQFTPNWRGGEKIFFQSVSDASSDPTGINRNYVQVLGQVRSPGEYLVKDNANFFYYLVQAGGPTDRAALNHLLVVRPEEGKLKAIKFSLDEPNKVPAIQGGDIVLVNADNPSELEKDSTIFGNIGGVLSSIATTALVAAGL